MITSARRGTVVEGRGLVTMSIPLGFAVASPHSDADRYLAGLEPALVRACRQAGRSVQQLGPRPGPLPEPVPSTMLLEDQNPAVLDLVRHHDRGLIQYDSTRVDIVWLIAEIALAWPDLTIAVVCRRIESAYDVRDRLKAIGVECVAIHSRNRPALGVVGRVVVTTPVFLFADGVDMHWRHIAIALDAVEVLGKRDLWCFSHTSRARWYGFLPFSTRPAPFEIDRTTALFGFEEVCVPANGCFERPVAIDWEKFTDGGREVVAESALTLKRSGIWHHQQRNAIVAALGRSLAAAVSPGQTVVVVVDGIEHLLALADHLDDWALWPALNSLYTEDLSEPQRKCLFAGCNPFALVPSHAITTMSVLSAIDLSSVAAVIRADGGTGLPSITPWQLSVRTATTPLYLVDITDRHHPALRRNAGFRREAYAARGWFKWDVAPVDGRVDRFMAERPVFQGVQK